MLKPDSSADDVFPGSYGLIFSAHGDPPPDPNLQNPHGTSVEGVVFSLFAGAMLGATLGAVVPWLIDRFEFFWPGVGLGALAGAGLGLPLGRIYRVRWGRSTRAHFGTVLGVIYGIIPSLLLVAQGIGELRGRNSGYVLMGCLFAGPMAGLILGGILDRAFEEYQRQHGGVAVRFALTSLVVACLAIGLFDWLAQGPDPEVLSYRVEQILNSHWRAKSGKGSMRTRSIHLTRTGRLEYDGVIEALFDGKPLQLRAEVVLENNMIHIRCKEVDGEDEEDGAIPAAPLERVVI